VFPDANVDPATGSNTDSKTFIKDQVGFDGTYVPTASPGLATSTFPAENNPVLTLTPYVGDLGLDNGAPSSVYALNQAQINSGALKRLQPLTPAADPHQPVVLTKGQTVKLADGSSVQFIGTRPWVSLSVRYDPGEQVVLVGALLLVIGLVGSLTGRRRRVWFRVTPTDSGAEASAGGLARAEYASFPIEFDSIVAAVREERNVRGNALP
jgi:cytochrome c biogenesis protein